MTALILFYSCIDITIANEAQLPTRAWLAGVTFFLKNTKYTTVTGEPIDPNEKYLDAQFSNYAFETYQGLQVYYEKGDDDFLVDLLRKKHEDQSKN